MPQSKYTPISGNETSPMRIAPPTQEESLAELRRMVQDLTVAVAAVNARMVEHDAATASMRGEISGIHDSVATKGETMINKVNRILAKVETL